MKWNSLIFGRRQFAASLKGRPLPTSGSASRSLPSSRYRSSSSGDAVCTTGLTWMRGSTNISAEGGPERSIFHGP